MDNLMGGYDAYYLAEDVVFRGAAERGRLKGTLVAAVDKMPILAGRRVGRH